jgi:hypothetical protein
MQRPESCIVCEDSAPAFPDVWALLQPDVLATVLASLPALQLVRLRRTCLALQAAVDPIILSRLIALRPWDTEPYGTAQRLYRLEACRGHLVVLGGFDTSRLPEGTPDDDQHDAAGCLESLEVLTATGCAADLHAYLPHASQRAPFAHNMPVLRTDLAAVCIDAGVLYAIGGRCGGIDYNKVDRMDLANVKSCSSGWEEVEPMVLPLSGVAAAPLSAHRFLVAGGANRRTFRATTLVQVYDSQSHKSWSIAAEMTQFRYFSAAVAIRENVVAALGGVSSTGSRIRASPLPLQQYAPITVANEQGSHVCDLKLVEVYDGAEDRWANGPRMLRARYGCAAALAPSGRAVAIGGDSGEDNDTGSSVEAVDLRAPKGVALASLPVRLWGAAAVTVPNTHEIMCIGGNVQVEHFTEVIIIIIFIIIIVVIVIRMMMMMINE